MALVSAIVDSREPPWVQQLSFGGIPVVTSLLDHGDLLVATDDDCLLAIERKTAGDLLNSIRDDRLWMQVAGMREVSPWAYLAITGTLHPGPRGCCVTDDRETGWNWDAVAGALLTVQELGVHIVQIASDLDYEHAIMRLACRDRATRRIPPVRDSVVITEGEHILASLPGIGSERAAALLKWFTPAAAISYLTWPRHLDREKVLPDIPGIGEGTQRRVRRALLLTDDAYLRVAALEDK